MQHNRPITPLTRGVAQPIGAIGYWLMHLVVASVETDPATPSLAVAPFFEQVDGAWHGSIVRGVEVPQASTPIAQRYRLKTCDKRAAQVTDPRHGGSGGSQGFGDAQQMLQCFVLMAPGPAPYTFEHFRAGLDH
ncbi:hypothetical protein D3C79_905630 [compost metagenome]